MSTVETTKLSDEEVRRRHAALAMRFPHMHHSTRVIVDRFIAGQPCACPGCPEPCVKRVVVNDWGTVFEADVCESHSEIDGKAMDGLPRVASPASVGPALTRSIECLS